MPEISPISWLLLIVFALFILQAAGGYLQIRNYQQAIRRMHKLGNVGVGQKRGHFLDGHVVIIACNSEGTITGAEIMDGIGVWARFHPVRKFMDKELVGGNVFEFVEMTSHFEKKQVKRYRGYVRAFEALEARLLGKELTREQEEYMAKRRKGVKF